MLDRRIDRLVLERRPQLALPAHRLLLQQLGEQVELLLEQLAVLPEVEAEQRERFGERAAPEDHLGAAVGDRVDGGEALEHPDRIVRTQHGHCRAEADVLGSRRDRRQHGLGGRDRKVGPVVLAEPDEIDAELIGQHRLVDDIADHLGVRKRRAGGILGDVAELGVGERVLGGHVVA